MTETTQILLMAGGFYVVAYALLPFVVKPRWKDLHGMANGRNSLTFIHVDPNAPHKLAVVAHELAEWQYRYRRPWSWLRWTATEAVQRDVNLWGPAVETAFAVKVYGVDESAFIRKEADALAHRDYFDENDGWDVGHIAAQIQRRMPQARKWVDKHLKQIEDV